MSAEPPESGSLPATPPVAPPVTQDPTIDQALADLADLDAAPLADHPERLARAHELLQRSLERPDPSGSA